MPCQGLEDPEPNAFCIKCKRNFYSLSGKSKWCVGCRPAPGELNEKKQEQEQVGQEHQRQGDEMVGEDLKYTWGRMGLKVGYIIVVHDGTSAYWVGEVKELVREVWVKGSKMVGDVIMQEYGCSSSGMGLQGKQVPRWKSKAKHSRDGSAQEFDQYAAKSPGPHYHPSLETVWAESIVSWGRDSEMLGPVSRVLLKRATNELGGRGAANKGKTRAKAKASKGNR
jgi:hypothetical protein